MFNKIKNNITSSITYNTMTSYTYVGKKKVEASKNYIKNNPVKSTLKAVNYITTESSIPGIITTAAVDCIIDKVIPTKK